MVVICSVNTEKNLLVLETAGSKTQLSAHETINRSLWPLGRVRGFTCSLSSTALLADQLQKTT